MKILKNLGWLFLGWLALVFAGNMLILPGVLALIFLAGGEPLTALLIEFVGGPLFVLALMAMSPDSPWRK